MARSMRPFKRLGSAVKPVIQRHFSCRSITQPSRSYSTFLLSSLNIHGTERASFRAMMAACAHPGTSDRAGPLKPGEELTADSGLKYRIESVLKEIPKPLLYVCRARAEDKDYVVKNVPGEFDYQTDLQKGIAASPNIRTLIDTVRESELLIFPFLASDLLQIRQQQGLSTEQRKDILRQALSGLADLHDNYVLHNDIKPGNILVDYEQVAEVEPRLIIKAVQIVDLDSAVIVPPGKNLHGPRCGNQFWRSPESWARSAQNQASDIFSFGLVAIYVMLNEMVFLRSQEDLSAQDPWRTILSLHISYFGDLNGIQGLLDHLGKKNPFFDRIIELTSDFSASNPRKPFLRRHGVDMKFRDLVCRMTNLAPAARITAREALEHEWFKSERGAAAPKGELEEARAVYERKRQC